MIVCERVFGVDHPDTIIAYVSQHECIQYLVLSIFAFLLLKFINNSKAKDRRNHAP